MSYFVAIRKYKKNLSNDLAEFYKSAITIALQIT